MLDALEAEIAALRAQQGRPAAEVRAKGITAVRDALAKNVGGNGALRAAPQSDTAIAAGKYPAARAQDLHRWMRQAGLSNAELGLMFGIDERVIEDWIAGRETAPAWVPVTVRTLALLKPPERRKLLKTPETQTVQRPRGTHPFSRIEEF
ncbi:MAG TPA: hypothetical protein VN428_06730 [Bryobacteraceae bacterium]|nr:hypothetical protein [Bryobacteraceae bacterium]